MDMNAPPTFPQKHIIGFKQTEPQTLKNNYLKYFPRLVILC